MFEKSAQRSQISGLNENHVRHIVTTFRHIDGLLSKAEHIMASAGSPSPFQEYVDDTTPIQRKVTHDFAARIRGLMRRNLEELRIPMPAPVSGARWAAQNAIVFANIALAEMESRRMTGYGKLSEAAATRVDKLVAELRAEIDGLADYLAQSPGADFEDRLAKLEQTHNEVPLLRELERVITAHGLVELRGTLAMLLERLENRTFEIGIFGRVSSGKSSLLNYLLGSELLPVGVTPVTAIPTRVRSGPKSRAVIEFADRQPMEIELSRLAEFSTEQQNPGNARHVTRILVEVPAARLGEGVTFVDTPGLGSLAASGAGETMFYLPRCDLGLVLVDAGSALTQEDIDIVQALHRAGARAMVLVSKADSLKPADRDRVLTWVKEQLARQLGAAVPAHLISVMGPDVSLCEAWFEHELKPLLQTHREQAAAALRRKIGTLRETVVHTLQLRLEARSHATASPPGEDLAQALKTLREADYLMERAEQEGMAIVEETFRLGGPILDRASSEIVAAWEAGHTTPQETAEVLRTALHSALADHATRLVNLLDNLRRKLETALAQASRAVLPAQTAVEPLPTASGLPLFDAAALVEQVRLHPTFTSRLLGRSLLERHVHSRIKNQLEFPISQFLDSYRLRLRQWHADALTELRAAFHARAGLLRPRFEMQANATGTEDNVARLAADLEHLQKQTAVS